MAKDFFYILLFFNSCQLNANERDLPIIEEPEEIDFPKSSDQVKLHNGYMAHLLNYWLVYQTLVFLPLKLTVGWLVG